MKEAGEVGVGGYQDRGPEVTSPDQVTDNRLPH